MHPQKSADAFLLVGRRVVDELARLQFAGIYADIVELSHIRVAHDLKYVGAQLFVLGMTQYLGSSLRMDPLRRGQIVGSGKIIYDRVKKRLYPFIFKSRTAKDREYC